MRNQQIGNMSRALPDHPARPHLLRFGPNLHVRSIDEKIPTDQIPLAAATSSASPPSPEQALCLSPKTARVANIWRAM